MQQAVANAATKRLVNFHLPIALRRKQTEISRVSFRRFQMLHPGGREIREDPVAADAGS